MAADENLPDEVPEADALEQRRGVVDDDATDPEASAGRGSGLPEDSFEVPEADAYEQSQEVGVDDEEPAGEG